MTDIPTWSAARGAGGQAMTDDIAMRLRGLSLFWGMPSLAEAADEIERLTRERDEARAEVERLREVISTLEIVGKAADDERARLKKEIERLHKAHETACLGGELLRAEVERLQAELRAMTAGFEVAYHALGAKP